MTPPSARHLPSNGAALESVNDPLGQDLAKWNGHRRLTTGADPPACRGNRQGSPRAAVPSSPSRSSSTAVLKPARWASQVPCRRPSIARKSTSDAIGTAARRGQRQHRRRSPRRDHPGGPAHRHRAGPNRPWRHFPHPCLRRGRARQRTQGDAPGAKRSSSAFPNMWIPPTSRGSRPTKPVNTRFGRRYEIVELPLAVVIRNLKPRIP